jgi:tRNA-specific 2-thiouridylase
VLCNREIKFDFYENCSELRGRLCSDRSLQKESNRVNGNTVYQLRAGADNNKDQSYFLCQLSQEQLSKSLFP